ncbi:TIGR03086 family metal-binding protein [Streptomyces sp. NPDC001480]|uniref:TIGR03086 family metal-binding protein n=1 Tax=Streptomyces sp. NPDC001480 TaxID=3364577 RepID=UPI003699978F
MLTNSSAHLDRLRRLDAQAVRDSVALVRRVTADDLLRPTPCSAWTLGDLLAHMTGQHRGFAAAALGHGEDLAHWRVRLPAQDATTEEATAEDAVMEYGEAAEQVITAFAAVAAPERPFALPELSADRRFPAAQAIGFHLIDYVVHSWDVARSLDVAYDPGPELLAAALPLARAVPDGDFRLAPDSAFRTALPVGDGATTLERILTTLGRSPGWRGPSGDAAADARHSPAGRDTTC